MRTSQLLTLAIDGFGAHMAIVGAWSCACHASREIGMQLMSVRANEPDGYVDWSFATRRGTPSSISSFLRNSIMDVWSRPPGRCATPCFPMTAIPRKTSLLASGMLCRRKGRRGMVEEAGRSPSSENARFLRLTDCDRRRRAPRSAKGCGPTSGDRSRLCDAAGNSDRAGLRDEIGQIAP